MPSPSSNALPASVLVVGAGPAGIGAALAAARAGAKVQVIETAGCLGGVWTAGMLTKIIDGGRKTGIMEEIMQAMIARGSDVAKKTKGEIYDPELMKVVLEEMCVTAGMKIQLHTQLVGAVTDKRNRLVAVAERLIEEADLFEPLAELALNDLCPHRLWLLGERLILKEGGALRLKRGGRDLLLADIERMKSRNLHRDVFHQLLELLIACNEFCLAIDLKEHTDTATGMDVRGDESLTRISTGLLRGGGKASLAKCQYGLLNIAAALFECALAIHHSCARALA